MRSIVIDALVLGLAQVVLGQGVSNQTSLPNALEGYPSLSIFRGLLNNNPSFLGTIIPNTTTKVTVLVPDNDALTRFVAQNGGDLSTISTSRLISTLKYHFLVSELTGNDFRVKGGLTVPTLLDGQEFNNRSANAELISRFGAGANGQVIYASADPINPARIKVRQDQGVELRGGLAQGSELTSLDGSWQGGMFQSVNTVLTPPGKCTATVRGLPDTLSALDNALNRTKLWTAVDTSQNITCLAPTNSAFQSAGNPDQQLPTSNLTNALLFHTLPIPLYSNLLKDGQEFKSLANLTVRVTLRDGAIYFNDAKLISPNVLTNNGLIQVLDKVMSPLDGSSPPGTSSSTPAPTSTATSTTGSSTTTTTTSPSATVSRNAAVGLEGSQAQAGLVAFMIAAMLY